MSKNILNEELNRMKVLSGLIIESDQEDYIKKQLHRTGEEPTPEEMANIMTAMQKNEGVLEEARERIEDFFDFLNSNPKKSSGASVLYTNPVKVNKYIVNEFGEKVLNPMFDKLYKNTRFLFRWEDTYRRAAERNNPEFEVGKRSGTFDKVDGYSMLENGKSGLYLPIVPTGSEAQYSVLEDGEFKSISKEEARKYMPEYKERESASGANFRPLIVDRIYKINAGGKTWENPSFIYKYLGPDSMSESLEGLNESEVVMIKEGQLGKAITRMLIEEVLKD